MGANRYLWISYGISTMWAESEQSDDAELGRNGIRLDVGIRELGKGSSGYRRATRMYGAIGID